MKTNVTTATVLDTRRSRKDGTFPVKLRVTFNRTQKYYATGISITPDDYEKVISPKPRGELKEIKLLLSSIEKKAIAVIEKMEDFSYTLFEKLFLKNRNNNRNVFHVFEEKIKKLKEEGRIGTAMSYQHSLKSLKDYSAHLNFEKVTPEFLWSYESWMLQKGNSLTTTGIYLRCLRALINEAIRENDIRPELYPFGKHRYQIPNGRNIKKALTLNEIEKIFNYCAEVGSMEEQSRDFWIFSYLCNGLNIKDIAKLKYKNVDDDKIIIIRSKTEHSTRQNQKPVVAILTNEAKSIISRWGNKPIHPESYIFPILSDNLTPEQEHKMVKQAIKKINKYMRNIVQKLGINKNVTTYSARHSFSTILKRSGASIEFISESLGHSNIKTTESYLDSFEDDTKKKFAKKLTDFGSTK